MTGPTIDLMQALKDSLAQVRLTAERRAAIAEMRQPSPGHVRELLAEIDAVTRERDEAARKLNTVRNAVLEVQVIGTALALLLHPEMGFNNPPDPNELLETIQGINRTCRDALAPEPSFMRSSGSAASNEEPKPEDGCSWCNRSVAECDCTSRDHA